MKISKRIYPNGKTVFQASIGSGPNRIRFSNPDLEVLKGLVQKAGAEKLNDPLRYLAQLKTDDLRDLVGAHQLARSDGTSTAIQKMVEDWKLHLAGREAFGSVPIPSLQQAVDQFLLLQKNRQVRERTLQEISYTLQDLTHWKHPDTPVSTLIKKDLLKYLEYRNRKFKERNRLYKSKDPYRDLDGTTRANIIAHLKMFFNHCDGESWCLDNPARDLKKPYSPAPPPEIFSLHESRKIMELCQDDEFQLLLPYFALTLFGGLRHSEVFRLKTSEIHLPTREIILNEEVSWSGYRRIISHIPNNLVAWLQIGLKSLNPNDPVCPKKHFWHAYRKFKDDLHFKIWPGNGTYNTFISYHHALHGSPEKTAAVIGRSTQEIDRFFRIPVTHSEAKSYFEIAP